MAHRGIPFYSIKIIVIVIDDVLNMKWAEDVTIEVRMRLNKTKIIWT